MKSEGEKPKGEASLKQEALNYPTGANTQEGLPSQASASSNAAPAEAKEESNQEPPTTAPAGEGQPPEAKAWESRKRFLLQTGSPEKPKARASSCWNAGPRRRGASMTTPCRPPPANRAANPA